jgi:type II secretory pathway pseudopilin PulG
MTDNRFPRRRRLAIALCALLAPGLAAAQSERERELEARIAELERVVQQLVARQAEPVLPASARAPVAEPNALQATRITPGANPNTRFSYGGFIKLDAMLTDTDGGEIADSSAGRLLYLPGGIPVGGADEGTDLDSHAQFSRFWFAADSTLDSGDTLRGYLEFDLFGGALGNEVATNTYGVTVRHAVASWNRWMAGQTWSNFQDVAALPDAVDFIGPTEGATFVRQAQVRYTAGPWSVSLENPETILTPFNGNGGRIASDDNNLPDLTARWLTKGDFGHFTVAGLLRQLKHETTTGIDSSDVGYGISLSGRQVLGTNDDLRYMLTAGRGISRYVGLAISNDGVLDGNGEIDPIGLVSGFVAWRHVYSPTLRSNLYWSMARFDNDVALTGSGITREVQSLSGNLIWTVLPKLDVGLELRLAERELESGASGELRRLQLHAKYSF